MLTVDYMLTAVLADGIAATVRNELTTVVRHENHLIGARQLMATHAKSGAACRIICIPASAPVFIGEAREPVDSYFNSEPKAAPQ